MAPRTRGKDDGPKAAVEDASNANASEEGNTWAQLAQKHWLKKSGKSPKVKVKPDILKKEIWDVLEKEDFPYSSLLALENLQILDGWVSRNMRHCS
jgi:intron-binding protein aquarius